MWIEFLFLDGYLWSYRPDQNGFMTLKQSEELEQEIKEHGRIVGIRLQMGY